MQFRAGILYTVLFVVVAAGAFGLLTTASPPAVSADDVEADYTIEEEGQTIEVDGQTFNTSSLEEDSGTLEYVNESAILEVEWSGGDTVLIEEGGQEFEVLIGGNSSGTGGGENATGNESGANESGGNESGGEGNESGGNESGGNESGGEGGDAQSFSLIGEYDDSELQIEDFEGEGEDERPYVIAEGESGERTAVPLEEYDGIDSERYETNDSIQFFDEEGGQAVEGQVSEIGAETVTVEYEGESVTEYELEDAGTVMLEDQEYAVYFDGSTATLSSDVEALETQQTDLTEFNERLTGLRWVIGLAITAIIATTAMAFMPTRG